MDSKQNGVFSRGKAVNSSAQAIITCILLLATTFFSGEILMAQESKYPALNRVMQQIMLGKQTKIAFLGGSVTWGATSSDPQRTSWRAMYPEVLEKRFPQARIKSIDASIGGKGSDLGVFRIDRDVIPYKPDLVFIEFAVNDGETPQFHESYEGVIRKLHKALPNASLVLVMSGAGRDNFGNKRVKKYNEIGEYYGLPIADVCQGLIDGIAAGKYKASDFLTDSVHLNDLGNKLFVELLDQAVDTASRLGGQGIDWPSPLTGNRYESAKMLSLGDLTAESQGWKKALPSNVGAWFDHQPSRKLDSVAIPDSVGTVIKTTLECSGIGVYYETLPEGGAFTLEIDGEIVFDQPTVMKHCEAGLGQCFKFLPETSKHEIVITATKLPLKLGYLLITE